MLLLLLLLSNFGFHKSPEPTLVGTWQLLAMQNNAEHTASSYDDSEVIYKFTRSQLSIAQDGLTETYNYAVTGSQLSVDNYLPFTIIDLTHQFLNLGKDAASINLVYYFQRIN